MRMGIGGKLTPKLGINNSDVVNCIAIKSKMMKSMNKIEVLNF